MFSGHLKFLKQSKIGERNKLPPTGWVRNGRDEGEGDGKENMPTLGQCSSEKHDGLIDCYYIEVSRIPQ